MFINQKGSPFLGHFLALCDIFRKKFFFRKFQVFFSKKNVLRFLSLRHRADLRRSRLVDIKHCCFVSKNSETYLIFRVWIFKLNLYSNNIKRLHKLEMFGLFDNFGVKLKHICIKNWFFFKKHTGQRIQLLLNGFRVLIQENVGNFTKNALQICKKKLKTFFLFYVIKISYKTEFISLNTPIGQRVYSLLNFFNVLIYDYFWKSDKNCKQTWKSCNVWNFCLSHSEPFCIGKLRLSLHKSLSDKELFLVERFQHSTPLSLSKNRQKLHKNVKNWKSLQFLPFWIFLGSLGSTKKVQKYLYKYIPHDSNFTSDEFYGWYLLTCI